MGTYRWTFHRSMAKRWPVMGFGKIPEDGKHGIVQAQSPVLLAFCRPMAFAAAVIGRLSCSAHPAAKVHGSLLQRPHVLQS